VSHRLDAEQGPPHLLVSVTEIRRRPGSRLEVHQRLASHGMGLTDVTVPEGAQITFDGELESIHEGVVLTGTAVVPWTGACRRCLREIGGAAELDIREVYETKPTDGETWPLEHDHVDLGPLLHDVALLALPLAPLCDDECRGPDPERFPAALAAEVEGEEPGPPKDPRWAALDDLEL
jgi:uncharacterized protein